MIKITVEGPPKSGKSILCHAIAELLDEAGYHVRIDADSKIAWKEAFDSLSGLPRRHATRVSITEVQGKKK